MVAVAPLSTGDDSLSSPSISMVDHVPLMILTQIQSSTVNQNPKSGLSHVATVHEESKSMDAQPYEEEIEGLLGAKPPSCPLADSLVENTSVNPISEETDLHTELPQATAESWAERLKHYG